MPLLDAREVRKFYGDFRALDGVSLAIEADSFVSIVGPNGAGKTTLVNVLTGLLPPTSGTVTFKGQNVGGAGPVRLARLGMARSFRLVNVFPGLSVGETIAVAVLTRLGRPARTLPLGDKKLLDVASAFALDPEVILLDEPTSGVSTRDKHTIMETLVTAARALGIRAIIQVEHDMDIVFGYSDRSVALHQGRVLADTTPDGIRADAEVVATVIGKPRG
jgi:branched-chain amino acid transport system ATP-binding protein